MQAVAKRNFPRETARIKVSPCLVVTICRSMSKTKANRLREASTFNCRRVSYLETKNTNEQIAPREGVQSLAQNFFLIAFAYNLYRANKSVIYSKYIMLDMTVPVSRKAP
jgi:hypothetical protein